jgi:hypothetical protein
MYFYARFSFGLPFGFSIRFVTEYWDNRRNSMYKDQLCQRVADRHNIIIENPLVPYSRIASKRYTATDVSDSPKLWRD